MKSRPPSFFWSIKNILMNPVRLDNMFGGTSVDEDAYDSVDFVIGGGFRV